MFIVCCWADLIWIHTDVFDGESARNLMHLWEILNGKAGLSVLQQIIVICRLWYRVDYLNNCISQSTINSVKKNSSFFPLSVNDTLFSSDIYVFTRDQNICMPMRFCLLINVSTSVSKGRSKNKCRSADWFICMNIILTIQTSALLAIWHAKPNFKTISTAYWNILIWFKWCKKMPESNVHVGPMRRT